ncbi:glycosyltransferase [Neorhizobium alkalisoli]|uniref:Glycosyltransferase involved in cell wall biosynthesis n=1 Tax=Neorhizobium alkalisoli TaxID=528178 RepID=A0A561QCG9_9HYPH|nr:glycosyltransferase [Neorhizobium alkalisoli]TWF48076.1 glycosyltransferase involved in cell wall biosynthesis [Neorhizobium alkalisoli]
MKIVHVIASIDPKNGGLQAVAMRIAAAQCGLGLEVHVVSYGSPAVQAQVREIGAIIPNFASIRWHLLPEPDGVEKLLCFKGRRLLRKVLKQASFLHIHGVWEPFLVHASKLAKSVGIPYCVCPAGMLDHWSLQQKSWKKKLALRLCYRRMLDDAAFLHVLNTDEVAAIEPLRFRSAKLVIPNGVFTEEFDPLPDSGLFKQKMSLPLNRRYILFLSRLHIKKGTDILAMAFAAISEMYPDVDLVVAGPDGGAQDDFMSLVEKFDIDHRVHLVGPVYGELKIEAMVDADCFCLPSRQEGFSMAITEALACGTPVVITDQCHFPEVGEANAGLIVPVDPVEVAKALAVILSDAVRARSMGLNGRRMVLEQFTWPAIADATLRGYRLSA